MLRRTVLFALAIASAVAAFEMTSVSAADARSPSCDMSAFKSASGLSAGNAADGLRLLWDGEKDQQLRMRLGIDAGVPTIRDLAVKKKNGDWISVATNVTPDYRVVAGFRRMSSQQLEPLIGLKVPLTPEIINKYKWDAFWDAPLNLGPAPARGGGNPPPKDGSPISRDSRASPKKSIAPRRCSR